LVKRVAVDKVGKLCIYRNGCDIKPRKYTIVQGFVPDHNLGVYNNGVDAIARALTERYFFCKDKNGPGFRNIIAPIPHAFNKQYFREFRRLVDVNMPNLPRLSRQQVVDRYTGSKRRVYEEAYQSLCRESLSRKDSKLHMFVKFEKQDLGKAPRGINPRDPRFNLELGRYLKHAEKPFFKAINKAFQSVTNHTVIKGLNADESARVLHQKWLRFNEPVAIGLDAEKFDAHVSVQALQFEHSFYTDQYPGDSQLKRMLLWQLRNGGTAYAADGKVKFSIAGTRSSGDLNTSLGNCLIMCGSIYAYARQRGVTIELANNGDDCVVMCERSEQSKFLAGLEGWFRHRGFSMVAEEPVYEFERIEFCQTKPILTSAGWRMVRNHAAVFKKDPMCLVSISNDKTFRKWLYAVGECGSILTSGVPVQSAFYASFKRHGLKCSDAFVDHTYKGTSMCSRISGLDNAEITAEARVSYYYAFGVLPDEQVCIEDGLASSVIGEWDSSPITRDSIVLNPGIKLLQ